MAKRKYYDENGNEVKRRGGCFKWGCLGVIAFFVVIIIIGIAGGGTTTEESASETSTDQTEQPTEEGSEEVSEEPSGNELLAIGESATIDDITYTVTNASYTDERNEFAETSPENVIKIDFTLENGAEEDYPVGMDTQAYVDGVQAETYPLGSDFGSVSAGRTYEGSMYYGVSGEQVELEWAPTFSFSGEKAVWNVTLE